MGHMGSGSAGSDYRMAKGRGDPGRDQAGGLDYFGLRAKVLIGCVEILDRGVILEARKQAGTNEVKSAEAQGGSKWDID